MTEVIQGAYVEDGIAYPESDGLPMAENTEQFDWIVTLKCGLEALFNDDPQVFVAGDLLWYPVRGNNRISAAPDAMVVFGRPKGYRGSYIQWREENLAPQVVFEVLSQSNTRPEMNNKREFYQRYGVEEYYEYDPLENWLEGWIRRGDTLEKLASMDQWVSPRLGIRFELVGDDLEIYRPDGERLLYYLQVYEEMHWQKLRAEQERHRADQEYNRAEQAHKRAEQAQLRVEQERTRAEQAQFQVEQERIRAEQERIRAEAAEQKLAELQALLQKLQTKPENSE